MTNEPAVLSIIGWHAGEPVEDIVARKRDDIKKAGRTIWLYHSQLATIPMVQQFGGAFPKAGVIFLKGGAYPTSAALSAREMSEDRNRWTPLPPGIGKVTGKLPSGGLVIGELTPIATQIDLWGYVQHPNLSPLRFRQGASTACAVPSKGGPVEGMKSRHRDAVAIGRLIPPYGIFLR
jgi:hypothetical protein